MSDSKTDLQSIQQSYNYSYYVYFVYAQSLMQREQFEKANNIFMKILKRIEMHQIDKRLSTSGRSY